MSNTRRHYFEVLTVLAQKDLKIRYRNSVLGFVWSLLNPLAYMVILTAVFSFLLRVSIPNFAAWVLIGMLVWRFFQIATNQSLFAIMANQHLVTRVYVPRYIIVLSNNIANFIGSILEFLILLPLLSLLGVNLTGYALLLPAILISEFLLVFGVSLSLSSLNVRYRDLFQLWDIALGLGFFLSPIFYDPSLIPARFQTLYSLNPITNLIESARDILLVPKPPSLLNCAIIASSIVIALLVGSAIFRHLEKRFAEEL